MQIARKSQTKCKQIVKKRLLDASWRLTHVLDRFLALWDGFLGLSFIFLPQKDDLMFIKNNFHFFKEFQNELKSMEDLILLDVTDNLLHEKNLDDFYSDDNDYGGHFTKYGNKTVSELIIEQLKNSNLI